MKTSSDKTKLFIVMFILSLAGCSALQNTSSDNSAADNAALRQADIAWAATMENGQMEEFFSIILEDASMLAPHAPTTTGKVAVRKMVEDMSAIPGFSLKWQPVSAVTSGDMGYTLGTYEMSMSDSKGAPKVEHGKYATIWRKQTDGSWKVVVDMFNSNESMPMSVDKK